MGSINHKHLKETVNSLASQRNNIEERPVPYNLSGCDKHFRTKSLKRHGPLQLMTYWFLK